MLGRLRGMFAFALVDLGREVVMLARDRLGVKPMYWHHNDGRLVFASEVRALVSTGAVPAEPDLQSIASYVGWGVIPGPRTAILGVRELPPGHFLQWSPNAGATTARWWWPTLEHRDLTKDDAVAQLRVALTDSVKRHLLADRPVGIFLSGGVDSGAVVQIASAMGEARALTVVFPDDNNEGASASAMAHQAGAIHDCVDVSGAEVSRHLPEILGAMDQPTADGVNTWIVCRAARQAGLTVALSGLGGDELFGGYPGFRSIPKVMRLARFTQVLPTAARRKLAETLGTRNSGGRLARLVGSSEGATGAYFAVRGLFPQTALRVDPDWTPLNGGGTSLVNVFGSGQLDPGDVVMVMESQHYLANQLLRDTDQMSMAHSLEVRVPLLDDEVVRLAWSIPPSTRNSAHKELLALAAGVAPGSRKLGFTLPMDKWIRGPLNSTVREALLSAELPFGDLIPLKFRKRLWEQFAARRTHWSRPWAIAVLRLWPGAQAMGW
jgi:asparagine synthase (glutamine-hydrolysing)